MKNVLRTTAALFALATSALAGSPAPIASVSPAVAPAVEAGVDWGGFYAGATYGTGVGGDMMYSPAVVPQFPSLEPGQSYGAFAGYNIQRNNLVFGGELAYSAVNTPGFGPIGWPAETFDYFIDGKARIGYAMNKVLVYGFAGYSASSFTDSTSTYPASGLNYGAGVDFMLGSRYFMGAEYIARNQVGGTSTPGLTRTTNIQEVQIRAGIRF